MAPQSVFWGVPLERAPGRGVRGGHQELEALSPTAQKLMVPLSAPWASRLPNTCQSRNNVPSQRG